MNKWVEKQLSDHPILVIAVVAAVAVPFLVGTGIVSPAFKLGQMIRNKVAPQAKAQPASGQVGSTSPAAGSKGIRGAQPSHQH